MIFRGSLDSKPQKHVIRCVDGTRGAQSTNLSASAGDLGGFPRLIWGIDVMVGRAVIGDGECMTDRLRPAAVFASVPALVVAAAWWIGDLSEDVPDPDFMFRPIELPSKVSLAVGLIATAVCVVGVVAGVLLTRSGGPGRRTVVVLVPWLVLAMYLGYGYRVTTAGVSGANIGGGLFVMATFIAVPVAVGASVAVWRTTRQRTVDHRRR